MKVILITEMNKEQQKVIQFCNEGKCVLMLGKAGSGKSFLIKEIKKLLPNKTVFLTSTTGVSALAIQGATLYSFFGIGLGDKTVETLLNFIRRKPEIVQKLRIPNLLIVVDEISMLPSELLTKLNQILKRLRNNNLPFGGVQFLFSGDFMQLETINADNILANELLKHFETVNLTTNYRQQGDLEFQELLTKVRKGNLTEQDHILLSSKSGNYDDAAVRLYCTNSRVSKYNTDKFNSIPGQSRKFIAKFVGKCNATLSELKKQFSAKNADTLELKKGCRVMLTWNVSVECGLVNGSIGTVKDFIGSDKVLVTFDNFGDFPIERQIWNITDEYDYPLAKAEQIPLIVSYALSIHKCQGITLDKAIIDLSGAFCNHQVYVALSRVKSFEGITLLNYSKDKVKVNKKILEFYKNIES